MLSDKQLKAKGFIPQSARAAMVSGGHTPPPTCSPTDFSQLPPQVKGKYYEEPETSGRQVVHRRK